MKVTVIQTSIKLKSFAITIITPNLKEISSWKYKHQATLIPFFSTKSPNRSYLPLLQTIWFKTGVSAIRSICCNSILRLNQISKKTLPDDEHAMFTFSCPCEHEWESRSVKMVSKGKFPMLRGTDGWWDEHSSIQDPYVIQFNHKSIQTSTQTKPSILKSNPKTDKSKQTKQSAFALYFLSLDG